MYEMIADKYHIAGFFEDKNFHELAFPRFSRGKFSRIVTDYKEYLLKSEHFEGKIFTNYLRFVKFAKNFPLKNNPLYGILFLQDIWRDCIETQERYVCTLHSIFQISISRNMKCA